MNHARPHRRGLRDSAESLRTGLAREGFAVDVAGDGRVGLSYARNNPYDVLVLDLMLPLLDGMACSPACARSRIDRTSSCSRRATGSRTACRGSTRARTTTS
jgi:CheY-like chemotaxis protein